MQHASVKKLFKEQVRLYSHRNQYKGSFIIPIIFGWLNNLPAERKGKKIEVCEFGGGAGQLLGEIKKSYPKFNYTNVEIIDDYKKFLVDKKINFVLGSILDSNFPDNFYDIIIVRDVLHHLIGRNYEETRSNQAYALKELRRLVKPKGIIFIEELTNDSEISTKIIYYLTLINSKVGINIPSLFVSTNVVVAFLTSKKLLTLCNNIFGNQNIKKEIKNLEVKWYFTLLHLFGKQRKVIITLRK